MLFRSRTFQSFEKFPADPGYDYILLAARSGARSWFELDPYLHLGAHVLSWFASLFPISIQAVTLSIVINIVWSIIGVTIFVILRHQGLSSFVSLISAFTLSLCPAAAESSLANVGNIKWPMLVLAIILASSQQIFKSPIISGCYLLLTGLTNPLTAIVFLPLILNFARCQVYERKRFLIPIICISIALIIQIYVVGTNGITTGSGGDRTYTLWSGIGVFWLAGLFGPPTTCLLIVVLTTQLNLKSNSDFIVRLSMSGLSLSLLSYLYGGIADRYFVAPMTISWISAILFLEGFLKNRPKAIQYSISFLSAIVFISPTVYWFNAMWFLTAGPKWADEFAAAQIQCESPVKTVFLKIGASKIELSCSYITNG